MYYPNKKRLFYPVFVDNYTFLLVLLPKISLDTLPEVFVSTADITTLPPLS
jgi:hypothetical protein